MEEAIEYSVDKVNSINGVEDNDKVDYMGNKHKSLKDKADADVEYILGEVNTVHYEGQCITATDTIERQVKSAILNGCTLVNSATKLISYASWNTTDNVVFTHNIGSPFGFINYDCTLKPNTKYLIKFNYDYISDENLRMQVGFRTNLGGWDTYHTTSTKGVNQFTLTTKDTSNNLSIIIMSGQTLTSATLGELMILEYQDGMENWDIPYFEGMESVKSPVVKMVGKNLCPVNSFTTNVKFINSSTPVLNVLIKKDIPLDPSETYVCSTKCNIGEIAGNMRILLSNEKLPTQFIDGLGGHNGAYSWVTSGGDEN